MVKDEEDIIADTLLNLDHQGVDGIIVSDNNSTDRTAEIVRALDTTCQLVVQSDSDPAYYQSQKMTTLAQQAFHLGADWVLPFDADEFWYGTGTSLRMAISRTRGVDCLHATLYNYFPCESDDPDETRPARRIVNRDPKPAPLPKVVVRNRPDVIIGQGNHSATATGGFKTRSAPLAIAHYPWRSLEQYERKIRNGGAAYAQTTLPDVYGAHWRQHWQILAEQGPEALSEVFHEFYFDPDIDLEYMPMPWRD